MRKLLFTHPGDALYIACAIVFLVIHVWIVQTAGASFPTPWPDEAHFLWQAHAIARDFSLFAPELNTERLILWMPPGYMIVVGSFFKIFGSSLALARFLSLACMLPAMCLLLWFLSRPVSRWWALLLWGLFIVNARFIACANIARMEALLLLLVASAFFLLQKNRLIPGLLLLLFTPLVHFNGLLFLAGGVAYAFYQYRSWEAKLVWNKWVTMGAVLLALSWIGYALLAILNWDAFVHDMAFQFGRKGESKPLSFLTTRENLLVVIVFAIVTTYAVRARLRSVELIFLAVPAWLTWRIGHELWYEVLYHVGFLAGSLLILDAWIHLTDRKTSPIGIIKRYSAVIPFVILLLAWNYRLETIEDLTRYPWSLDLQTMHYTANVPYITTEEKEEIVELIDIVSDGRRVSVQFEPAADAFLILPFSGDRFDYTYPLFQQRQPDICVVHYSRYLPGWWQFNDHMLARAGIARDSLTYLGLQRGGTEQWFIVPIVLELRRGS